MKKILFKTIFKILRLEARVVLFFKKPEVIAVTGSVGKTSTKEAIYHLLKDKFDLWKNPGNLNAEIGIPLTILGYKKINSPNKKGLIMAPFWGLGEMIILLFGHYPKMLVIEMGVEHKNDIKYFCDLVKPKVGVVTAVSPVHLDDLGDLEGVYQEKASLIKYLPKNGTAVLNQSDPRVAEMAKLTSAKIKYFSCQPINIYREAAIAVAGVYGISTSAAEERLKSFQLPKKRMNIIKKNQLTIIDDSYNSNPLAARAMLLELGKYQGRKIAILGDMLEQGKNKDKAHREIGELAGEICDRLIFVGNCADLFEEGAKNKLDLKYMTKFKDSSEAAEKVSKIIQPDDVVLIKGSRGVKLEKVVARLKQGV